MSSIRSILSIIPLLASRSPDLLRRLRGLPAWFRALLGISLLCGLAAAPAPRLAYWLVVGTITEVWPWQLWGEPYLEFADRLFMDGVHWVYLLVLGALGGGLLLLLRRPAPRGPLRLRLGSESLGLLAFLLVFGAALVLSPLLLANSVRLVRTFPPRTDHLLRENCAHCHSPYRPQHYIKPPEMWQATVRRMIDRNGAPVGEDDAARIVDWLQDYRSFPDSWMFRAKCERCHHRTHLLERERTAEEWAFIVRRLAWFNPFAFREDQRAQLERYAAAQLAAPPPPEGSPERAALEERLDLQRACNPCHSISLVLEEGAMDDPRAIVERMSEKNPVLVPPERVDALTEALRRLPEDEAGFWDLFPHDVLMEPPP